MFVANEIAVHEWLLTLKLYPLYKQQQPQQKVFLDDWKVLPPNEVAGLIYFQVILIEYSLETQLSSENEKL